MYGNKLTSVLTAGITIALLTTSIAGRAPPQQTLTATDLPAGIVLMWSGDIQDIPPSWALCDGTNDTPDLRDKFIVGAGNSYALGDIGGQTTLDTRHNHGPGSYTALPSSASTYGAEIGLHLTTRYHEHTHPVTGTSAVAGESEQDNRPPYHALVFIMLK